MDSLSYHVFMRFLIIIFSLLVISNLYADLSVVDYFPVNGEMRTRVDFWKKVYTEINTNEAFIHDSNDLSIIYKKVELAKGNRNRRIQAKQEKKKIALILNSIAKKNYTNLNQEESNLATIIGKRSQKELLEMTKNIRYQYGLRDRYYKGLIRSYKYLDFIKETFKNQNLPQELVYLPHVESSFNYDAYSKVGAAGIWQFMRYTGRIYGLKIGYVIDERRDPLKATIAASRLLKDNFQKLQSWPLALTAYNHGAKSIERAINKYKTRDINTIIEKYNGRRFGFASKNFYATFMATVEISKDPEKYFKSFKKPQEFEFATLKLDRPFTINEISNALKLSKGIIRDYNHSIRSVAFRSDVYLPKDITLKLPIDKKVNIDEYKVSLSKIETKYAKLGALKEHIISSGESLYYISKIYRVDLNQLIVYNRISNPSQIYPGLKIKIPTNKDSIKIENIDLNKKIVSIKPANKKEVIAPKRLTNVFTISANKKDDQPPKEFKRLEENNLSSYSLEIEKLKNGLYQITVESDETIGHYAEWANVMTQKIRYTNGLGKRSYIKLGQKIKLPIKENKLNEFKQLRAQHHLSIQEDFFANYSIVGKEKYHVKKGETLSLILRKFSLPLWLFRSQSENIVGTDIKIGQNLTIPKIESISENASLFPEDEEDS